MPSGTIHMLEDCDFSTSLELGVNKSNLAADTSSVIKTAKTLKLPETKKWLLQEELTMP